MEEPSFNSGGNITFNARQACTCKKYLHGKKILVSEFHIQLTSTNVQTLANVRKRDKQTN